MPNEKHVAYLISMCNVPKNKQEDYMWLQRNIFRFSTSSFALEAHKYICVINLHNTYGGHTDVVSRDRRPFNCKFN